LPGDGIRRLETELAGNEPVQLLDLRVIAVEQREERGLRAGRSLHAAELELTQTILELGQIKHQIVAPQRGPFADGRRLRRLQMREAQARQITILDGKPRQMVDDGRQLADEQFQPLPHQQQVGVVGDVATGGAEVNDRPGGRANVAVGMHVGNHIVPEPLLIRGRGGEVDVIDMGPEFGDLRGGDFESQLALGFGQRDPQFPPGAVPDLRRPEPAHVARGVAGYQGVVVEIVGQGQSSGRPCGRCLQQDRETGLYEMTVCGQCFADAGILHDDEGHAIGERPVLVAPFGIQFQ
jgi:hypothetical protein